MARLLLVSLALAASQAWMSSGYCPNEKCPPYQVIKEHQEYEEREYGATTWISTNITGPADVDVLAAHSRLNEYCRKLKDEDCQMLRDAWPVTITVAKGAIYLSWFVCSGMKLSDDADLSVRVRERRGGVVYARSFGGIPSRAKGEANVQVLWGALEKTCDDMPTYSGGGYEPYLSLTHHNEVWIYADDVCENAE